MKTTATRRSALLGIGVAAAIAMTYMLVPRHNSLSQGSEVPAVLQSKANGSSQTTPPSIVMKLPPDALRQRIESALTQISTEQDDALRERYSEDACAGTSLAEIPRVLALIRASGLAHDSTFSLHTRLVRRWAESDPVGAADAIDTLPPGKFRDDALEQIGIAWAQRDVLAAFQWACGMPSDAESQHALLNIASEAVRTAPQKAIAVARELPSERTRDEIIARAAAEWAATAPADAATWAEQLNDDSLRERAMAAVAIASAEKYPLVAADLASHGILTGRLQDDTLISVLQRWIQIAPEQAAAWVDRLPSGRSRTAAVNCLAAFRHISE